LALREELVTIFNDLMSTADEVHVMLLKEPRDHVWTEGEAHTSVVLTPSRDVFVGVGPQKIAEESTVGDLCQLATANASEIITISKGYLHQWVA